MKPDLLGRREFRCVAADRPPANRWHPPGCVHRAGELTMPGRPLGMKRCRTDQSNTTEKPTILRSAPYRWPSDGRNSPFTLSGISIRIGRPGWDRRLAGVADRLQRSPDLVHAVGKQIADQQVSHFAFQVRIGLDEIAEAEPVVVFAHQPPHPIDAAIEQLRPSGPVAPPTCRRAASPSAIASAAISPDFSASSTPDEYSGSRNPKASPISTQPSPATCVDAVRIVFRRVVAGRPRRRSTSAP